MKRELRHLPKLVAVAYYAIVVNLRSGRSFSFLFDAYDLLLFGIIPATTGIIGILKSRCNNTRTVSWALFILGVTGIALSFIPWRYALKKIVMGE